MTIDIGFIKKLRQNLRVELADARDLETSLAAFDRAALSTILENNEEAPLTRGQKAARTRAKNRKAREAAPSEKVGGTD